MYLEKEYHILFVLGMTINLFIVVLATTLNLIHGARYFEIEFVSTEDFGLWTLRSLVQVPNGCQYSTKA